MGLFYSKNNEDELPTPTNKRHADHPEAPHTPVEGKHSGTEVNLVLLGMSGTGKSASGNTILRKKQFMSRVSSNPVTTECQDAAAEIGGRRVCVIDTPDIFDDEMKSSDKNKHVSVCKELCQSGPCVYLLVMQASRFTDDERDMLHRLERAFGRRIEEQTVILFTCGGDLKRDNISHKDFFKSLSPELRTTTEKCGNRCVLFDNKAPRPDQVKKLMQTVDRVLK